MLSSSPNGKKKDLSALPDHLSLHRLDTRTVLSNAVLARRWAHQPTRAPRAPTQVSDILLWRYNRALAMRRSNAPRNTMLP
jgi:hypothetical protein